MPVIPTFTNQESAQTAPVGARANPEAFAAPGQALAQGAARVGATVDEFEQQYLQARRATDAANLVVQASKQGSDIFDQTRIIPDRAKALSSFDQQWNDLQQQTLNGIQDPLVRAHVAQRIGEQGMILRSEVDRQSLAREGSAQVAQIDQNGIDLTNQMAINRDPLFRAHTLDTFDSNIDGAVAAGWLPAAAGQLRKQAFRANVAKDDVMQDFQKDPAGTYARVSDPSQRAQAYPNLAPEWADMFALRHEGQAKAAQARSVVDGIFPNPAAATADQSQAAAAAVQGTPIPARLLIGLVQHESSWDPSKVGSAGEIGLGQVKPSTAQAPGYGVGAIDPATLSDPGTNLRFAAQYLAGLGKAKGVTDWSDPAQVRPVLEAYNGSSNKAAYADAVLHLAGYGQNNPQYPDTDALAAKVLERTAGDPQLQERALADLSRRVAMYRTATAADRSALERSLGDLKGALEQGVDAEIPVDRIRALLPPQQAQDVIQDLTVRSAVGQAVRSVQWQTPEELAGTVKALESGTGTAATMLNLRLAKAGIPVDGDPTDQGSANFRVRQQALSALRTVLSARQQALTNDPASYVATEPSVALLLAAVDPEKPETFEAYAARTKDVQQHLGVPASNVRVLAAGQARGVAQQLLSADPSKVDAGAQLDTLEKTYGNAWPDVWHDLVRDGKMPASWQVLAQMQPGPDRIAMQRALQAAQAKGGAEKLRGEIDSQAAQQIDQGLPAALDDFRRTVMIPGLAGNAEVFGAVRQAVRSLAYWNVLNGQSASTALQNAADAALPYDWEDSARAPRGQGALADSTARAVLRTLKPGDLAPPGGGQGMRPEDVQDAYLAAVRRAGTWVTNERGDGWVLAVRGNDGAWQFPQRAGGGRVEFKFADMPRMQADAAPADAPDPMMMVP